MPNDQRGRDRLPVLPYLTLIGVFTGVYGGLLVLGAKKKKLPRHVSAADIFLLGAATHRLSRIATRDKVAAPLREPFTEYRGPAGAGEVDQRAKGTGLQRAIGTLVTCEYCAGPWVASALFAALVVRPRETRVVASMLAATAVSDFLHQAYTFMRHAS
jgi:hypothetical protein